MTAATADRAPGSRPEALVQVRDVTRRFGDQAAVRDLTFDVQPGIILGMIGPSGSGKTTTVRMLTGILAPTQGEIRVLGEDPKRFSRRARERIAYMPQLFSLYEDLTARENVGFVAALFGIFPWQRGRLIRRALEVVDLWDARNRRAKDLSGGMQRRLELACALVHDPQVAFLDEPTAGVDPILRQAIWDELRRMRDAGLTLVITTQYVGEAEYCDRVALLAEGELVALDAPEQLRQDVFGGELLQVETDGDVDPGLLGGIAGISIVRRDGPRRLLVVAEDAGRATPRIVEAIRAGGVGVAALNEYQPGFDEVFADLVVRRRDAAAKSEADPKDDGRGTS
jgi:ABC-2 type transport system ATP-binding protein